MEGDLFPYTLDNLQLPLENQECFKTSSQDPSAPPVESTLDTLLNTRWSAAVETGGIFRYTLPHPLPFKILPGSYSFLLQLNPERGLLRRKAETISSLGQPFDPKKFHFNRVPPSEVLFSIRPRHWGQDESPERTHPPVGDVLINVSPLEWGHVLLTPNREANRPQRLSEQGLRLALELGLLSNHPGFRLGFNSLCGYASVNHEHYHAYYLDHKLYLQDAELTPLVPRDDVVDIPCYELVNYPAKGLVWVLEELTQLETLVGAVMRVGCHLQAGNVAHNLFITRGASGRRSKNQVQNNDLSCLRIFLWARESSYGAKESDGFNPALCELGGHFPCKNQEAYERLDEAGLVELLSELTEKPWSSLRHAVVQGLLLKSPVLE